MKAWQDEIRQHINGWSGRLGNRGWWPKYVYHFTDVSNAANVIRSGVLYSRAQQMNLMQVDNASRQIIQQTTQTHQKYVRLYFRPRTPTQFNNEGIRPRTQRSLGSHCPVPVFFCFDALDILSRDNTEFSNGNMARRNVEHGDSRDLFRRIPFEKVFHDGAIQEDKDAVIFHRCAEVLVPDDLRIDDSLRLIACRSVAEREMLLYLLPANLRSAWQNRIRIGDQGLFERKWTYLEQVTAISATNTVIFRFNPNTRTPGPFHVWFTYCDARDGRTRLYEADVPSLAGESLILGLPNAYEGEAILHLDDALAFQGWLVFEDIPF